MSSAGEGLSRPLPEQVRSHVVELAAQILGAMPAAAVPSQLKGIAKFDPRKRARLGSAPIAAQLENDKEFRELVAEALAAEWPDLVASLAEGVAPPAAEPSLVAAAAYLTRPPGWADMVEAARDDLERSAAVAEGSAMEQTVTRLREQLAAQKAAAKEEGERLREQLKGARSEISDLRRRLHDARERARAAEARTAEAEEEVREAKAAAASAGSAGRASCAACASASPTPSGSWRPAAGPPARAAAWRTPRSACCSTPSRTPPPDCAGSSPCPRASTGPPTRCSRWRPAGRGPRRCPRGRSPTTTRHCSTSCSRCRRST
ncbi:hypothetical protein ACQP10_11565 [Streptosporangium sandarakinum]|uniref:hypothetical protein n=1 Tax=Streptosporangium sandarakinum TaxID=1260955 RepID=UPI003D8B57CC